MKKRIILIVSLTVMITVGALGKLAWVNIEHRGGNKTDYKVETLTVEGHSYILAYTSSFYGGNVSIIHAEHCKCKKKK